MIHKGPAVRSDMNIIAIKRAYDPPSRADGTRILVDRLWPRGIRKQQLQVKQWMRELGPSNELRRFFGHNSARWDQFRKRYLRELKRPETANLLRELVGIARQERLTLIYSAKDEEHNQAVILKELLEQQLRGATEPIRTVPRPGGR